MIHRSIWNIFKFAWEHLLTYRNSIIEDKQQRQQHNKIVYDFKHFRGCLALAISTFQMEDLMSRSFNTRTQCNSIENAVSTGSRCSPIYCVLFIPFCMSRIFYSAWLESGTPLTSNNQNKNDQTISPISNRVFCQSSTYSFPFIYNRKPK